MKKIMPYIAFSMMIISVVLLGACGRISAKSGDLELFYEKNSAQKVFVQSNNYAKMLIEVKNNGEKNATVSAKSFRLLKDEQEVSDDVFFGNNIVDRMEEEVIAPAQSAKLVVNLRFDGEGSAFDLYFDQTFLASITI